MDGKKPVLWTIGHSNREAAELVELLRENAIERLVDVRTVPRSRRNPQFNRESLPETLDTAGILYRHERGSPLEQDLPPAAAALP